MEQRISNLNYEELIDLGLIKTRLLIDRDTGAEWIGYYTKFGGKLLKLDPANEIAKKEREESK